MDSLLWQLTSTFIPDRNRHKVILKVAGREELIRSMHEQGIVIKLDPSREYACFCFSNIKDYYSFRKKYVLNESV